MVPAYLELVTQLIKSRHFKRRTSILRLELQSGEWTASLIALHRSLVENMMTDLDRTCQKVIEVLLAKFPNLELGENQKYPEIETCVERFKRQILAQLGVTDDEAEQILGDSSHYLTVQECLDLYPYIKESHSF